MGIKDVKKFLEKYSKEDIVFGKTEKYVLERIGAKREEVVKDLLFARGLEFVEKQERGDETRYVLFFVFSKRSGRVYVVTMDNKLRIITAYPLGRKTLSRYHKKRFINLDR